MKNQIKSILLKIIDVLFSLLTLISAIWLKFLRKRIVRYWDNDSLINKYIFNKIGVNPITDHYYEPLFDYKRLKHSLSEDRLFNGIDFNLTEQLSILKKFNFNYELIAISNQPKSELTCSFSNTTFCSGDADYLYNIIRLLKPRRIIEIGCGN